MLANVHYIDQMTCELVREQYTRMEERLKGKNAENLMWVWINQSAGNMRQWGRGKVVQDRGV